jgi:HEAT repeat protein
MKQLLIGMAVVGLFGLAAQAQPPAKPAANTDLRKHIEKQPMDFLPIGSYVWYKHVDGVLALAEWKKALVPTCVEILKDSEKLEAKLAAVVFLGKAQDWTKDATAALFNALDDNNVEVRRWAVRTLSADAETQKRLAGYRDHKDSVVRLFACCSYLSFSKCGEAELSVLLAGLEHPDCTARCKVLATLAQYPPTTRNAVPALLQAMQTEPYSWVKARMIRVLPKMGAHAKEAVPALIALLQSDSSWYRSAACESLGDMGRDAQQAAEALRNCMNNDQDDLVRIAARKALERVNPAK